jgi:hypothetical protein
MACVKCFTLACRDNAEAEPPALTHPKRSRCSIFAPYANARADKGDRDQRAASWLNQIEIWFSILVRKLIRRSNFANKDMLKASIEKFIAYLNATMAKPFRWTYAGKPLAG